MAGMQVGIAQCNLGGPRGWLSSVTIHKRRIGQGARTWLGSVKAGAVNAGGNAMKPGWKARRGRGKGGNLETLSQLLKVLLLSI